MKKSRMAIAVMGLFAAIGSAADAATIISNNVGSSSSAKFWAQSFTIGASDIDAISFSFFTTANVAAAAGTLSIFTAPVTTPTLGGSSTTNLVARSVSTASGVYSFDSTVTLLANTTYYAYSSASLNVAYATANNYTGGQGYNTSSTGGTYAGLANGGDTRFALYGTAVPEPESWAMMIGGFGAIGTVLRRRRRLSPLFG